jgi:hypothetical protein
MATVSAFDEEARKLGCIKGRESCRFGSIKAGVALFRFVFCHLAGLGWLAAIPSGR